MQRFSIGDPVEVVPDFKYGEWHRLPLWIAGVVYEVGPGILDYWVSEQWPPRHLGDVSDRFREDDLMPRTAPATPISASED